MYSGKCLICELLQLIQLQSRAKMTRNVLSSHQNAGKSDVSVLVTTLKGLWEGDDAYLNKILLVISITLPGLMEVMGMLLADEPLEINSDDVSVKP